MRLLDANTIIHYFQGRNTVVARLQRASPQDLMLPSVVAYELNYGTFKNGSARRKSLLADLFETINQAPFDGAAAVEAARIRAELEACGLTIGPLDLMIAGTAVSLGAILITNNTRELSRIEGLRLEDWSI